MNIAQTAEPKRVILSIEVNELRQLGEQALTAPPGVEAVYRASNADMTSILRGLSHVPSLNLPTTCPAKQRVWSASGGFYRAASATDFRLFVFLMDGIPKLSPE